MRGEQNLFFHFRDPKKTLSLQPCAGCIPLAAAQAGWDSAPVRAAGTGSDAEPLPKGRCSLPCRGMMWCSWVITVCPPLQVAIKSIRKDRIKDEQDLIHIRREIEIMSSLNHPHIIAVHEGELLPHCLFSFQPFP